MKEVGITFEGTRNTSSELAEEFRAATDSSPDDLILLRELLDEMPSLPDDPAESVTLLRQFLIKKEFSYSEGSMTLHDVLENKSGNCLSLTMLICILLKSKGKKPTCKVLIHPKDAVDGADRKLFEELMEGKYFKYDNPKLPDITEQPEQSLRSSRFVSQGHPIVILDGVPIETTLLFGDGGDPIIEFPSESSESYSPNQLMSFVYSDQAKVLLEEIELAVGDKKKKSLAIFVDLIEKSLAILPDNRYALRLRWQYARETRDKALQDECLEKYKSLKVDDSDYNYSLWSMTDDVSKLERSLQQFPENIHAFIDKRVFLEKDPREARFNLAVAMWCIYYSGALSLKSFYNDSQMKNKIMELFPHQD